MGQEWLSLLPHCGTPLRRVSDLPQHNSTRLLVRVFHSVFRQFWVALTILCGGILQWNVLLYSRTTKVASESRHQRRISLRASMRISLSHKIAICLPTVTIEPRLLACDEACFIYGRSKQIGAVSICLWKSSHVPIQTQHCNEQVSNAWTHVAPILWIYVSEWKRKWPIYRNSKL